ncbi:MAG: hypothetical protein F4129_07080 [Acidimicrobiia bacterium]|nr:hypothetical protein [Acidimicrobiia bacterium]
MVEELKDLLIGYARQEILTPLTRLGKTLKLGVLGALSIGVGLVFLVIAGLRLLQTEASGVFDGNMSALPYVVVLAGVVMVLAAAVLVRARLSKGDRS